MKIAMMVRGYIPVPRPLDMIYAPIDLAVAIAQGLSKRGHDIDFYAPLGSSIKGVKVVHNNLRPLATDREQFQDLLADVNKMNHYFPATWEGNLVNLMFDRAKRGEYDLLHFHHPEVAIQQAHANRDVPVAYTLHDPLYDWYKEMFDIFDSPNQNFISISNNQRRDAPDLAYVRTVHDGVDIKSYAYCGEPEDYLLYAGRIVPEKGIKEAIAVAKKSNHRLLIIGPVYSDGKGYFDQYIKPQLDNQILYLGFVEQKQLAKYYQKAKALLTPVQWEEPFGLTTIEAMASGTPVISFNRGAAPEIIDNGRTGYVVNTTAEMIEAVYKINRLSRAACREHVKANFSLKNMVDGYELAFEQILRERSKLSPHYVKTKLNLLPRKLLETSQRRRLRKVIRSKSQAGPLPQYGQSSERAAG